MGDIDLKDLEVGHIYEIDDVETQARELRGVVSAYDQMVNLIPLSKYRYFRVISKTPNGSEFDYDIMPLDNSFKDSLAEGLDPNNYTGVPRLIPYSRKISSSWPIYINNDVGKMSPLVKSQIAKTELDKQKSGIVGQIMKDPNLAGTVRELAGLPPRVSPRIAGKRKTRKGKKSKRKTHKRK
jgi:hypothetical protein